MFSGCLYKITSRFFKMEYENVYYMKGTFSSLKIEKIPDISKW